ncbi:MAG: hypothetical protein E7035_04940 [Verrucomicrobiaceae bacterium]|nr:hypothetical protein [Verrucomicrobiaceae bacterium]
MKKIIPIILMSATCAFASNSSISIPQKELVDGNYYVVNGSNNKATAAVSGDITSFKAGFHVGSSGGSLKDLDVKIEEGFTLNTGFYYNGKYPSIASGATITIGNRLVDGERVFDEGTLQATGGYSAAELWFRGEDRAENAVWHIGTQQELAMAGVRVDVEACNTVYLYNVTFRNNTQVNVDATSQLYMTFVNATSPRFGSTDLNGKFRFSMSPSDASMKIAATATMNISGQKADDYSTFGNNQSKWLVESSAKVNISNSEANSILLGTKSSGIITIQNLTQISLSSSNALAANETNGQDKITLEISTTANSFSNSAKLILNADENGNKTTNSFASVWLRGTSNKDVGSNFVITLNGNELIFGNVNQSDTDNIGFMYITDFVEGLFKIETIADKYLGENNEVSFLRAGTDTDYDALYWDSNTGYITATAVPEPAEWAVVLGALAIAFAFMRRQTRK